MPAADTSKRLWPATQPAKPMSELVGPSVQVTIGQPLGTPLDRHLVGGALHLRPEEVLDAGLARELPSGFLPAGRQGTTFLGGRQQPPEDRQPGIGDRPLAK